MRLFLVAAAATLFASACASTPTRPGADSPEAIGSEWAAAMERGDVATLERITVPAALLADAVVCGSERSIVSDVARWRKSIPEVAAKGKKVGKIELARFELKRERVVTPGQTADGCTAKQEIRLVDANLHLAYVLNGRSESGVESIDVIGIGDRWYLQQQ